VSSLRTRIRRLCTFTLVSLLSLSGLAGQAGAQDSVRNQLNGSQKSRPTARESGEANIATAATGYTYSVLYSFGTNSPDGYQPYKGVILDAAGNLYGTTISGGATGYGAVFEVDASGHESVLYSFCPELPCPDGYQPDAGFIQDAAGNLYGTTVSGGADGGGTVFKVDATGHQSVLYSFCSKPSCVDGARPEAGLIQDTAGNLYGTTYQGGTNTGCGLSGGCGTVFKVDITGHETVLYSFCSAANCMDGDQPEAALILDAAGNLYGTASRGGNTNSTCSEGASACGVVFKMDSTGHETVLYSFCSAADCTDGDEPQAGLIRDAAGNLYGTTTFGGAKGGGTVFKVDTSGHESVLYSFCSVTSCADGYQPYAGLIQDAAGNLYGTTYDGGANIGTNNGSGGGTVFKLDTTGHETVLYSFCSTANCTDGELPRAGLILDAAGNLYSTTTYGGIEGGNCGVSAGCGTVFKLTAPAGSNRFTTFDAAGAGTGENEGTVATSINTAGTIAGFYIDSSNVNHGFVRATSGTITEFETADAGTGAKQGSKAYAINTAGVIAGAYLDSGGVWHSFVRASNGTITEFSASGAGTAAGQGTFAFGINTAGVISGLYTDANSALHGFERATNGTITEFDVTGAGTGADQGTGGISINTAGEIAGYYIDASNVSHGFERAASGVITAFDVPGAGSSAGQGTGGGFDTILTLLLNPSGDISINTAGVITGYYLDASNAYHGFARAANGTMTEFSAPCAGTGASQGTVSSAVNTVGTATGYCIDSSGVGHGFVRPPSGGTITDFDAPDAGTDVGAGTVPYGINTAGTITGTSIDASYVFHGFVLIPLTPTTTTLSSLLNPSVYGQAVNFTATVTSKAGAPPDGETVSLMKGKTVLGTGTLSGGSASLMTSALTAGTDSVTAVYGGDTNFASSTSKPVHQVVSKATTTTTLTSSPNPSSSGQAVTFTASLTPEFGGTVTGTVTFYDGATVLKTVTLSAGTAKFTTKTLAVGTPTIKATYNGSTSFDTSSFSLIQTVN
jgi:uncharacterized repeat protein (TIGR03803 family)